MWEDGLIDIACHFFLFFVAIVLSIFLLFVVTNYTFGIFKLNMMKMC